MGYLLGRLDSELKVQARDGRLDAQGRDAAKVELMTICAERIDSAREDVERGGVRGVPVTALDAMARLLLHIDSREADGGDDDGARGRLAEAMAPNRYLDGRACPVCYVDRYEGDPITDHHTTVWLSCGHRGESWFRFCPHCGRLVADRGEGGE